MMNFVNSCGPYIVLAFTAFVASMFIELWFKSESIRKSGNITIQQGVTFAIPSVGGILVVFGLILFMMTDSSVTPGIAVLLFAVTLLMPEIIRLIGPGIMKRWAKRVVVQEDDVAQPAKAVINPIKNSTTVNQSKPEIPSIKFTDKTPRPVKPIELNLLVELSREMLNMKETLAATKANTSIKSKNIVKELAKSSQPTASVLPGQHDYPSASREAPKRRKLNVSN